jgi:hypothetical protein
MPGDITGISKPQYSYFDFGFKLAKCDCQISSELRDPLRSLRLQPFYQIYDFSV